MNTRKCYVSVVAVPGVHSVRMNVPGEGLEPSRAHHSLDFKSNASANSATPALHKSNRIVTYRETADR